MAPSNPMKLEKSMRSAPLKQSKGKTKIKIEPIKDPNRKHVTFSKRRHGLFKKTAELCVLCGAQAAVITFSERGKLFSFGHPNADTVIARYISGGGDTVVSVDNVEYLSMLEEHNKRYGEIARQIKEEKQNNQRNKNNNFGNNYILNGKNGGFWWDQHVEELGLNELERYLTCLEELRVNVGRRVEHLENTHQMTMVNTYNTENLIQQGLYFGNGSTANYGGATVMEGANDATKAADGTLQGFNNGGFMLEDAGDFQQNSDLLYVRVFN